jgi:hypothetical protein
MSDTRTITLSQGQFATVDASDYEWLNQWKWSAWWNKSTRGYYAVRVVRGLGGKRSMVWMHRLILGLRPGDGKRGDHREPSETLNNSRSNLRISTPSQNNCNSRKRSDNTSGFKGVCLEKNSGRWMAVIRISGKQKNLGRFSTPQLAHQAYRKAATEHRGEFARFA